MIPNRIVIDTNVLLDLFVFQDPRWQPLLDALEQGRVQACTRVDCATEWCIVLDYPHLPLDATSRAQARQQFDRLLTLWNGEAAAATGEAPPLPVCKDKDDQKFLELARDCQASALITKDKALLKLARRTARIGLFQILTPQAWQNGLQSPAQS